MGLKIAKIAKSVWKVCTEFVGSVPNELLSLDTIAWNRLKMPKIVQNVWKMSKECVRVCEGVCEGGWKFLQWVPELVYMLLDNQHVVMRQKSAKVA